MPDECCTVVVVTEENPVYLESQDVVLSGKWTPTVSLLLELLASDTIPLTHDIMRVAGSVGAITMTSTPTIDFSSLVDGQHFVLHGRSETKPVTLQDETNLPGSGLHFEYGRNMTLGKNDLLEMMYVEEDAVAIEVNRVENY